MLITKLQSYFVVYMRDTIYEIFTCRIVQENIKLKLHIVTQVLEYNSCRCDRIDNIVLLHLLPLHQMIVHLNLR